MTGTDSTNGFADPTVTDRIARILAETPPALDCAQCRLHHLRPCRQHQAAAIVDAMRAQDLVALTRETADNIVETVRAQALTAAAGWYERRAGQFDEMRPSARNIGQDWMCVTEAVADRLTAEQLRKFAAKGGQDV
jgi:hypothetical protein